MKRKLLVIGILALLVIFMMPMASAASPAADARMRTEVWLLSGCDNPVEGNYAECTGDTSGPVGTFTMSSLYNSDCDNSFKRIYSIRGLLPNTQYLIVLFDQPGGEINARFSGENHIIQLPISTDAKGWLKSTQPTCDYGKRSIIKAALESHQYWVGLILASGG